MFPDLERCNGNRLRAANEPDLIAVEAGVNSVANISNGIFHAVKIKKKVFLGCHLEVLLLEGSALRAFWLPEKGSNLRHPGPKPGVLPLNYLAKMLNGWRRDVSHFCGSSFFCSAVKVREIIQAMEFWS